MKNKGFSLVELLIVIAIFGILLAALTAFFISHSRQYMVQKEIVAMQDNARVALDFVVRMLRNSDDDPLPEIDGIACDHTLVITDVWGEEHKFRIYDSDSDGPNTLGYEQGDSWIDPYALNITCFNIEQNGKHYEVTITAETERVLPSSGQKSSITLNSSVKPRNID